MKTSMDLLNGISGVFTTVNADGTNEVYCEMIDGSKEMLLAKSKRIPTCAQLFERRANGNSSQESIGRFFTFSKSSKNLMHPSKHLKTYFIVKA